MLFGHALIPHPSSHIPAPIGVDLVIRAGQEGLFEGQVVEDRRLLELSEELSDMSSVSIRYELI